MHDKQWKASVRRRLLKWFDKHQRDLPWRKNKTPYRIWVSEIMLQQTQVVSVVDYFKRFVKRFPSVSKLAAADEADVLKLWEGLGYYRRARQLHAAARKMVDDHGGKFPTDFDSVIALPGIGRYTAGAILSISKDERHPILEGNTIRLFARLMGMKSDPRTSQNQHKLWSFSESLLPRKRVGDFNQALMELGSEICTPRKPGCDACPLMNLCPTFTNSWQNEIPVAGKKMVYENVNEAVVLVRRADKFLIRRCATGERWAGLWDFPRFRIESDRPTNELQSKIRKQFGLRCSIQPTNHQIKHAVTRFRIQLDCYLGHSGSKETARVAAAEWKTLDEIDDLAMSVTGRKIARQLRKKDLPLMLPLK